MAQAGTLRERLLALVEELWVEAEVAAAKRSRVESRVLRSTANRMLAVLGQPERSWSPPPEEPPAYLAHLAKLEQAHR
jgi:hypothetical protein